MQRHMSCTVLDVLVVSTLTKVKDYILDGSAGFELYFVLLLFKIVSYYYLFLLFCLSYTDKPISSKVEVTSLRREQNAK